MDEPVRDAVNRELRFLHDALETAVELHRDGTPVTTALRQTEQRLRAQALARDLGEEALAAVRAERELMVELVGRAIREPDTACAGQDPLDWLAMVLENRAQRLSPAN
jgi:hypothetical protein